MYVVYLGGRKARRQIRALRARVGQLPRQANPIPLPAARLACRRCRTAPAAPLRRRCFLQTLAQRLGGVLGRLQPFVS